jgi:hypothetical protein
LRGTDRAETLRKTLRGEVEPVERRRSDLPAPLAALVARALDPDPDRRFPDAATMRSELDAIAVSLGPTATIGAVRDRMQALFAGAAERDPWAGQKGPVTLELSRLVAEGGITVLTAHDVPVPRRWRRGLARLGALAIAALAIALAAGASRPGPGEAQPRPRRVDSLPAPRPARPAREPEADRPRRPELPAPAAPAPPSSEVPDRPARETVRRSAPARARAAPPSPAPNAEPSPPVRTGRLRVGTSPGWGWVWVDGRRLGSTPLDVELVAGPHRLRVVADRSGRDRDLSVVVEPDGIRTVFLEPFE